MKKRYKYMKYENDPEPFWPDPGKVDVKKVEFCAKKERAERNEKESV